MALNEKYAELVNAANTAGVANLAVREQDNVLYIDGEAPSTAVKDQLWAVYDKIDPNYSSGDLVLNLTVAAGSSSEYEVQPGDSLSKIGKKYGKTWQEIYEVNKAVIGDNPDLIQVGWKLQIPA
ncbi:MAG TPA: LysM peptidoglycan-binding domain-containing protein [Phnomibacter sp.]|nr:LysM peptidoglycan-binding domain-containing protein [Phnomibacter sp.]